MRFFQVSILTQWPTLIQFKSKIIHYSTEKVWNCLLDCAHTLSVQNIVWMAFLPHSLRRVMMQLRRQPSFDISVFMHPHTMEKGENLPSLKRLLKKAGVTSQKSYTQLKYVSSYLFECRSHQNKLWFTAVLSSYPAIWLKSFLQKSHWILI